MPLPSQTSDALEFDFTTSTGSSTLPWLSSVLGYFRVPKVEPKLGRSAGAPCLFTVT